MKNLNNFIGWVLLLALGFGSFGWAQNDLAITITNSNLALIRESRVLNLEKGLQKINLQDIPEQIDPTSVLIESKNTPFRILEQNYEYDLLDVNKILSRLIDQEIMVTHPEQGRTEGKMLSFSSNHLLLLDSGDNLQIIPRNTEQIIQIKNYSGRGFSFIAKPTLLCQLQADKAGLHQAQLSYLSRGLNWQAYYVGRLNETDTEITLAGWVSIDNRSGKSFSSARLKLMAGDLNVVQKAAPTLRRDVMMTMAESAFEEQAFFEYHLYTLQRPADINNNQVKQIQLFPETVSKINKTYRVDSRNAAEVKVVVSLKNSKEQNLGFPLPAGIIRLYKSDGPDLEYIGENQVKHTAENETIDIEVGKAFDIAAERRIVETQRPTKRSQKQTIEYVLRNHKREPVEIEIMERVNAYQQSRILSSSHKPVETRADYFKFKIPVKANDETVLNFIYEISW